jgi:molybdate transport system regulatory protein
VDQPRRNWNRSKLWAMLTRLRSIVLVIYFGALIETDAMQTPKLTLRIDMGAGRVLGGPGKVRLLEGIDKTGSIAEAARDIGMSYKRAWELVNDLKSCFPTAIVKPRHGRGGRTALAPLGKKLITLYRCIEAEALLAVGKHFHGLKLSRRSTASVPITSIRRPLRKRKVRPPRRSL